MQGQVYVPYTGIGGTNMNSGIMTLGLGGSSLDIENATQRTFNVTWTLPGGIQNIKNSGAYEGGEWGYMLWTKDVNPNTVTDEDVVKDIIANVPGSSFDSEFNLETEQHAASIESYINNLLYNYVNRALTVQGGSSWDAFYKYYSKNNCIQTNF